MSLTDLARMRLLLTWREMGFGPRGGPRRGGFPGGWIGLGLMLALMVFFTVLLGQMFAALDPGPARALLTLCLQAAWMSLLLFDLHYAVASLILDSDLPLLRVAPISVRQLVMFKLADAFPRTSAPVWVLVLPAAVGFAGSAGLPWWAWLLLPIQLLSFWAVPLGLGGALSLVVIRYVPRHLARQAFGLGSSLLFAAIFFLYAFVLPRFADQRTTLEPFLGQGDPRPWSPADWLSSALVAAKASVAGPALGWTVPLVITGVIAVATIAYAGRFLDEIFGRMRAGSRRPVVVRDPASPATRATGPIAALVARDGRLFARDWSVLSDVLSAAALWPLVPLISAPGFSVSGAVTVRVMVITLSVGLGLEAAARSIPFERGGIAWGRLAPVHARAWLWAKLLALAIVAVPTVTLATALIGLGFGIGARDGLIALAFGLAALGVSLPLGLWTGIKFGDPSSVNPRTLLTLAGRYAGAGLLAVQLAGWLALSWLMEMGDPAPDPILVTALICTAAAILALLLLRAAVVQFRSREWPLQSAG